MVLIFRKLYRLSGIIFPLIYFFTDRPNTLYWLAFITAFFLLLEISRFYFAQLNHWLFKKLQLILKPEEGEGQILGVTYFLLGALLTVFFFPKLAAITALLFLVFGDACAAIVGARWGKIKIGQKTLEGGLAFLLSSLVIVLILQTTYLGLNLKVGLVSAFVAALVELLPLPINDNLSVPLICAWVIAYLA